MTRAIGIDLSKWDVSFDPAKATMPIDFAIQRASYAKIRDQAFDKIYEGVAKVGITGSYHYLSTGISWQEQADFFLEIVEGRGFGFYVCDFEGAYNAMSIKFAMEANQWMDYVARATGKPVLLYTNPNLYDLYAWHYCAGWPLWIAQYWLFPSPNKNPGMPKRRKDWNIWQFSADRNRKSAAYGCGARSVDINVYNGTVDNMKSWLGVDQTIHPIRERQCPYPICAVDNK